MELVAHHYNSVYLPASLFDYTKRYKHKYLYIHILMFIKIDNRESDLLTTMNLLFREHSHEINVEKLDLGDIILLTNDLKETIIFERKSLYDLAASIKDGRYNEQSFRLNDYSIHNHNVVYIIEGDFERYNATKGRMDKKTLYSALVTLNYFKGFSVIRTKNINETCELIINYADKLQKEPKRVAYYGVTKVDKIDDIGTACHADTENKEGIEKEEVREDKLDDGTENKEGLEENGGREQKLDETIHNSGLIETVNMKQQSYCEVMKKQKKNNITEENIGEIMLSTIPGVSSKSAITIMKVFKTIKNLIEQLQTDGECLNDIKIEIESGQLRKISKTCIENIKKFILK